MPTFNSLKTEYKRLWDRMTIKPSVIPALDKVARGIIADRRRYEAVEATTGVPWFWIGITHNRESGRNFKTHLHNGDPLTARTRQVPKGRPIHGRPPFKWETSAEDALIYQALDKVPEWGVERIAYCFEDYNGWGYRNKAIFTPYLWAGTNHYSAGKYVADGVFSRTAVDRQLGCMPLLKRLMALDASVMAHVSGEMAAFPPPPDVPKPAPAPPPVPKPVQSGWLAALVALITSIFRKRQ